MRSVADDDRRDEAKKACLLCGSPIPLSAIYCKECGNYQFPIRRFLAGIDMSGLTAFISTTALVFTFLNVNLFNRSADIVALALACDDRDFSLTVTNEGTRPAVFDGAVATRTVDQTRRTQVALVLKSKGSDPIFQPAQDRTVELGPKPGEGFADTASGATICYSVRFQTKEFNGATHSRSVTCGSC
jgi:hypothetical protein